ncbi:hypothetical protein HZS_4433 [Henneguya salminicola]|uniref:7-dehydrocholesterol reductase n=1 Tax=Henneguya salminicola TaxID=69463 RepID=A0A6G3MER6_HENSL|nr:hypothetical protein HZS_4433 [Henneguya salminicola]
MKKGISSNRKNFWRYSNYFGIFLIAWPILFVYFFQFTIQYHNSSLASSSQHLIDFFQKFIKNILNPFSISLNIIKYFLFWYLFQLILYLTVPGKITTGQVMRSGQILSYKCNGLYCLIISNITVILLSYFNFIDPAYYVDHITEFLALSNIFGVLLTFVVYFKALFFPNNIDDCFFSGSTFYDIYSGVEHSPRIGRFDFKQFFNERVGIALWPLINLSYTCKMYRSYGYVTNSMLLVNFLQVCFLTFSILYSHIHSYFS